MNTVIFDLYETLITEFQSDWKDPNTWGRLGLTNPVAEREWRARHEARMKGHILDFPSVLREICVAAALEADESLIAKLYQERLQLKALPFAQLEPQIVDMIRSLKMLGLKVGVLSNAAVEEVAAWESCPLSEAVDSAVFSYAVGLMKPEPELYALACERLDSAPCDTLFVGDGGSRELAGARMAGLTSIWATWFLDRWPSVRIRNVDPIAVQCHRCRQPSDLIDLVNSIRTAS